MPAGTDDQQKVLENHRRQPERGRLGRCLGQRQRHLERMVGVVSKTGEHSITIAGNRAACFVQKSESQLRPKHAGADRVPRFEKIGLKSYFPGNADMRQTSVDVGWNNATRKEERQKFMNLQRPRSGFPRQALYGVIAIVCVASLPWSSPLVLAQEAPQAAIAGNDHRGSSEDS